MSSKLENENWPSTKEAIPHEWITRLFDHMLLMFGKRFTDQWSIVDPEKMKLFWAKELCAYTNDELAKGYAALKTLEWPPSLPEFLKLCRPPINPVAAYEEAIIGLNARRKGLKGEWSHKAVYHAAIEMSFDLQNLPFLAIKDRWQSLLKHKLEMPDLPEIPEAPQQIEPSYPVSCPSPDLVKIVDKTFAGNDEDDGKNWARKIMHKVKNGIAVPAIVRTMAEDALRA